MEHRIPKFRLVLHAAQMVTDKLREELAEFGGTATQGRVLDVIDRLDDPVPARVGEVLNLTASAMSQMVKRLRSAQLIEPSSRAGGRAYSEHLVLSQTGETFLGKARQAWARIEQDLDELVGEDAMEAMFRTSYDIIEGLGATPPFPKNMHLARRRDDTSSCPRPRHDGANPMTDT